MVLRLTTGLRVMVKQNIDGIALNATGTVKRVKSCGDQAFVALDERSKAPNVHPFHENDEGGRGTYVEVHADDCELEKDTGATRRKSERAARCPVPTPETWGQDHWSTFAYIETRVVDHGGDVEIQRMRCNPKRHPWLAHAGSMFGDPKPTRLAKGELLPDHDDWDCAEDMCRAYPGCHALLVSVGCATHPRFQLTETGYEIGSQLRRHKAQGGSFSTFVPAGWR